MGTGKVQDGSTVTSSQQEEKEFARKLVRSKTSMQGVSVGPLDGVRDGVLLGDFDGSNVGVVEGGSEGVFVGMLGVGKVDGMPDVGEMVGIEEVGDDDGRKVGRSDGGVVGREVVGEFAGASEGLMDGK